MKLGGSKFQFRLHQSDFRLLIERIGRTAGGRRPVFGLRIRFGVGRDTQLCESIGRFGEICFRILEAAWASVRVFRKSSISSSCSAAFPDAFTAAKCLIASFNVGLGNSGVFRMLLVEVLKVSVGLASQVLRR